MMYYRVGKFRAWAHFFAGYRKKTGVWNALAFHCSNSSPALRRAAGFPLQSRMHGRQTVLFYQHGASPTVYFYGLLAKCDQPLALLLEKTRWYNRVMALLCPQYEIAAACAVSGLPFGSPPHFKA
jgi:hypothetical protein